MTKLPDDPKLTGFPAIVTPGPPAEIVVPAIGNAVGFGHWWVGWLADSARDHNES